jgi:NADPH2:quinone reductase
MTPTMLAARYPTSGPDTGRIRVERVPRPHPGPGEVLVRVAVSAVNPTDWKARAGSGLAAATGDGWVIPNQDGAGAIVACGPGVPGTRVGERVWLWQAQWQRPGGTAAEYVAVPAARAVTLPGDVALDHGALLGIPAITAHRCLFGDGPLRAGDAVLVHGGAGAVGNAAVALTRRAGARVAATVSGPEKAAWARAAGAELVVDYTADDVAARVLEWAPDGVARIVEVDLARNLDVDAAVLRDGGTIVVYAVPGEPVLPPARLLARNATIHFMLLYTMPEAAKRAAVEAISAALAAGDLPALPVKRFGLDATAAAHEAVRTGTLGRVLIDVSAPA